MDNKTFACGRRCHLKGKAGLSGGTSDLELWFICLTLFIAEESRSSVCMDLQSGESRARG
jgi:hypothetical protein